MQLDKESRTKYSSSHAFPGLGQSKEVAKWLWEQQFAAVAGDNPAFECIRTFLCLLEESPPVRNVYKQLTN